MGQIGLQIGGRGANDFEPKFQYEWSGRNIQDHVPKYPDDLRVGSEVFYVQFDEQYETYVAAICKFKLDGRQSWLQLGIRIPSGSRIISSGRVVSPIEILRPLLEVLKSKYLKEFGGEYEFKYESLEINQEDFTPLLAGYELVEEWGRRYAMASTGAVVYVSGDNDIRIGEVMHALPLCDRFESVRRVEIGQFTSKVQLTAISDEDLTRKPSVILRINCADGRAEEKELGNLPEHLNSSRYGYDKDEYEEVTCPISYDEVMQTFKEGRLLIEQPGVRFELLPSKGLVTVTFSPRKLSKDFMVVLKGAENEDVAIVMTELQYNGHRIEDGKLTFKGKNIRAFEQCDSVRLQNAFLLSDKSRYQIDSIRRENNEVSVKVSLKDRYRPSAPAVDCQTGSGAVSIDFGKISNGSSTAVLKFKLSTVRLVLPAAMRKRKVLNVSVTQESSLSKRVQRYEIDLRKVPSGGVYDFQFVDFEGSGAWLSIEQPSKYKFDLSLCRPIKAIENVDYEVDLSHAEKNKQSIWRRMYEVMSFCSSGRGYGWLSFRIGLIMLAFVLMFMAGFIVGGWAVAKGRVSQMPFEVFKTEVPSATSGQAISEPASVPTYTGASDKDASDNNEQGGADVSAEGADVRSEETGREQLSKQDNEPTSKTDGVQASKNDDEQKTKTKG